MTKRVVRMMVALLAVCAIAVGIAVAQPDRTGAGKAGRKPIRLEESTLIVEINQTDGDAGIQLFLDNDPWDSMKMMSPDGRTMLDVETKGRLKGYGLTELFSESSEPPFDEFPLRKFKRLFPEGTYKLVGTDIKGRKLIGRAKLSHDIPDGPNITSPSKGAEVPRADLTVTWDPAPEPEGINIVGYRVIVEREDPLRIYQVELKGSATSVRVPSEFFQANTEYKVEVMAIERSGNQTLTEVPFTVTGP
jgi:hypothetical protein